MAFKVSDVELYKFNNMNELVNYTKNEINNIKYIPLSDYINRNSLFFDDEFFGRGKDWVSFNIDGFVSFCSLCEIPIKFINKLTKANLVSNILNNYLSDKSIKEKLMNYQFVVDISNNIVLGLVSKTYKSYYNNKFINDLQEHYPDIYNYEFAESYIINTKLYLRLLSNDIEAGLITGRGGEAADVSRIGLQLSNSMVGDSTIKIQIFILRLLCANGLTADALNIKGTVMHSGKDDTFYDRLYNVINPFMINLNSIPEMLRKLTSLAYSPEVIVEAGGTDLVYNIIPLNEEMNSKRKKLKGEKLKEFDINTLHDYPYKYAGQYSQNIFNSYYRDNYTMFDFINVFTEYAHKQDIKKKLQIENNTGELVNWIINSKEYIDYYNVNKANHYLNKDNS